MFQYKVVYLKSDADLEVEINKYANDGQELFFINSFSQGGNLSSVMWGAGTTTGYVLIFKKAK